MDNHLGLLFVILDEKRWKYCKGPLTKDGREETFQNIKKKPSQAIKPERVLKITIYQLLRVRG